MLLVSVNLPPQPPIMSTKLQNLTVYVGETVTLKCDAISGSQLFWNWVKVSVSDPKDQRVIKASGFNVTDPNELTLENLQLSDSGFYLCLVDNVQGRSTSEAWIEVIPPINKG